MVSDNSTLILTHKETNGILRKRMEDRFWSPNCARYLEDTQDEHTHTHLQESLKEMTAREFFVGTGPLSLDSDEKDGVRVKCSSKKREVTSFRFITRGGTFPFRWNRRLRC